MSDANVGVHIRAKTSAMWSSMSPPRRKMVSWQAAVPTATRARYKISCFRAREGSKRRQPTRYATDGAVLPIRGMRLQLIQTCSLALALEGGATSDQTVFPVVAAWLAEDSDHYRAFEAIKRRKSA